MEMKKGHKKAGMLLMAVAIACSVLPTVGTMGGNGTSLMEVHAGLNRNTHALIKAETMKKSPSASGSTVMKLPKKAQVVRLMKVGSYSFVKVNGKQGYVKTSNLVMLAGPYA